jgi:hypothetical protein
LALNLARHRLRPAPEPTALPSAPPEDDPPVAVAPAAEVPYGPYVFISYSRDVTDAGHAKDLARELPAAGVPVWWDQDQQWLQSTSAPASMKGFVVPSGSLPDLTRTALLPLVPALNEAACRR